jgi:hypothetical protein
MHQQATAEASKEIEEEEKDKSDVEREEVLPNRTLILASRLTFWSFYTLHLGW